MVKHISKWFDVNTARFLAVPFWPFWNIVHERVKDYFQYISFFKFNKALLKLGEMLLFHFKSSFRFEHIQILKF